MRSGEPASAAVIEGSPEGVVHAFVPDESIREAIDLGDARGVTQIRVHGVGGATPESMLDGVRSRRVAGDAAAGFYRPAGESATGRPDRHIEAYSWGALTSRSRTRALWIFLLPCLFANLAGWASPPASGAAHRPVARVRLAAARLAALALTVSAISTMGLLGLDVVAYQCGGQPACASSSWWLAPLTFWDIPTNPGHRLAAGTMLLGAVLVFFAVLSRRTRSRYEDVPPPEIARRNGTATRTSRRAHASAAHLPDGLADPRFWNGSDAHARLDRLHLAMGAATTTVLLGYCLRAVEEQYRLAGPAWLGPTGLVLAAVAAGGAVALACVDLRDQRPSMLVLVVAVVGLAVELVAAIATPQTAAVFAGQTPGIRDAVNLTWLVVAGLIVPLWAVDTPAALSGAWQFPGHVVRLVRSKGTSRDERIGRVAPSTFAVLGIVVAQVVLLALLTYVAQWLANPGKVSYVKGSMPISPADGASVIHLPLIVPALLSYMLWTGVVMVLAWLGVFVLGWWRAGYGRRLRTAYEQVRDGYAAEADTFTGDLRGSGGPVAKWLYSAMPQRSPTRQRGRLTAFAKAPARLERDDGETWLKRVARWQYLAGSAPYVSSLANAMAFVAVVIALFFSVRVFAMDSTVAGKGVDAATRLTLLIPPALLAFIALSWRQLSSRKVIGSLWDVGTFWPRAFHPFAPPCYAERAVPELLRRIWWLRANGGQVVVAGHSQGSIIAGAAALQSRLRGTGPDGPDFALVTFGSPLRKLYAEVFPAYWSRRRLKDIAEPTHSLATFGWVNVCYPTDYVGGVVGLAAVDRVLTDPSTSVHVFAQPPPPIRTHTGYLSDRRFLGVLREVEDRIAARSTNGEAASARE